MLLGYLKCENSWEEGDYMTDNPAMKRALIMQSFAPLFLILLIKYFDFRLIHLCKKFFEIILRNPIWAFTRAITHSAFVTLLLELFCLLWIIYSVYSIRGFEKSQRANFVSAGESLIDIEKISDSGVTFFMTYVLPMAMDDLDTWKGLVVFGILMAMLFSLMWKTNLYYQNPVLTVLGYEVFSFEFETTQLTEYNGKECIGITRGTINVGHSIKRQKISDNVFLVYEDR